MQLFILPFDFYLDNSVNSDMVLGQNNKIFKTHTKIKHQKKKARKKKLTKIKAF